MRIDLKVNLEKNLVYSGVGNIFSKLVLMRQILLEEESFLIIVENESRVNAYSNIGKTLGIEINTLNSSLDISDLIHNKKGKFVVCKDIFYKDLKILNNKINIKKGVQCLPQDLAKDLNNLGIEFSEYKNNNSFHILGDTLNYIEKTGQLLKISFWDNEIDGIIYGNKEISNYTFVQDSLLTDLNTQKSFNETLLKSLSESGAFILLDSIDFYSEYDIIKPFLNNYVIFTYSSSISDNDLGFKELILKDLDDLLLILKSSFSFKIIISKNVLTIKNFLDLNSIEGVNVFETDSNKLKSIQYRDGFLLCDDNLSRIFVKKRVKKSISENIDLLLQIKKGDYVVHIDHGVGIFEEVVEKSLSGIKKEYLELKYAGEDKLFVPITELGRLSKYVGVENPKLTSLSTKEWAKKLEKASEDVEKVAEELLEIYANRKLQKGYSFIAHREEENRFFSSFDYVYTDDQINVISEIYKDMESEAPMDRLLSGDVGFGKTEVAFASIFKAIINGKQAALISPLVVLAYEHYEKAKERFINYPFNIEVLTRFESSANVINVLKKLEKGQIDLIIGTHRLLSEDVKFKDLGLLVIDEEHKFGVRDKEKIKSFKGSIDILSMSATPIPRSLNMALNGLKEVSMLMTPPIWKQSIETVVSPFSDQIIQIAAKREFDRGGQVFFVHNRVETILAMQSYLENLLPGKKVQVVHGQLVGDTLEKRILSFKKKEYDILLATTVIENGIDFHNVNTIFINEAQNFGISQIHQLRGRVGRGQEKAYAYLLFRKDIIKEDAVKRLKTIVDYSHLGAGFELAIKDLEIRGGGEILGIKQSGSSESIGITLFLEMLEEKILELKKNKNLLNEQDVEYKKRINVKIDLNVEAYLPDNFFTSDLDKLNFYREFESIKDIGDLNLMIEDFKNLGNKIEKPSQNLFDLIKIKIYCSENNIETIKRVGINYQIDFKENIELEEVKAFLILDKEVKFFVVSKNRLRTSIKNFENDEKFIQYLILIFENKLNTKKIKIKKKL